MMRKVLIGLAILLILMVGAALYLHHRVNEHLEREVKARPEPRLIKGEGLLQKRIFYTDEQLGNISQILVGWPAEKERAALTVVGSKGAHFLDVTGRLKKQVRFSKSLFCPIEVARIDAAGDYAYLNRDESWFSPATLFDKEGQASWSYSGGILTGAIFLLSGVDDSVSGDVYGDGKLSVVVGLNGDGGLVLVNREGKTVWKKKEGNVWHVETLETNGDGRQEILHSNAKGQLLVRDAQGNIIAEYLPNHCVSDFTLTRWGEESHPTHILVPTTEGPEGSSKSIFVVLDASGKIITQLESPLGKSLNKVRATPIRFGKGAEYFAVLQNNSVWERSMLLLYGKDGDIAYQEILGETCLGLAAFPEKDAEQLLIGCAGKIWEYSPVPQTTVRRSAHTKAQNRR